jgi:hypothetical protein
MPHKPPYFKPQAETPSKMQHNLEVQKYPSLNSLGPLRQSKLHVEPSIQIVDEWTVSSRRNDGCFSTCASTFLHPANPFPAVPVLGPHAVIPVPSTHLTAHSPVNVVPARISPRPQPADPRVKRLLSLSQLPSLEHRPLTYWKKKASRTRPVTSPQLQTQAHA